MTLQSSGTITLQQVKAEFATVYTTYSHQDMKSWIGFGYLKGNAQTVPSTNIHLQMFYAATAYDNSGGGGGGGGK